MMIDRYVPRASAPAALLIVAAVAFLAAGCGDGAVENTAVSSSDGSPGPAPPATSTPAPPPAATPAPTAPTPTAPTPTAPAPTAPTPTAPPAQKQFPPQAQLNKIVAAYTVASDRPELVKGLPCYCPCELYGHGAVIDCHRSQHAAMCDVCLNEAIEANQLYEAQLARGEADIAAVQAQVKDRYRRALVAQTAEQLPLMNTRQGTAFLEACSDCHQPPSPVMHTAADWDTSLMRMEQYAQQSGAMPAAEIWQAARAYVEGVAAQTPATRIAQTRSSLERTVRHLQETEGDAAYYPSVRDSVLDPAWAQRVADAYNEARDLPTELLADTPTACGPCRDAGNGTLLACLNSWQAITCETAIEEVEALLAEVSQ